MRTPTILALFLLVSAFPARAQVCSLTDAITDCQAKAAAETRKRRTQLRLSTTPSEERLQLQDADTELKQELNTHLAEQKTTAESTLRNANTGASPATASGASSTINDFVSMLKISADSGGVSEGSEELTFELNQFLRLPTEAGYKLDATVRQATIFEPLETSLNDAGETALLTELDDSLGDSDDVAFAFTYSPMTERLGRSDHQLHAKIFLDLFTAAQRVADVGLGDVALQLTTVEGQLGSDIERNRANGRTCPARPPGNALASALRTPGVTFQQVAECVNDTERIKAYMRLVELDQATELSSIYALQDELRKNQFFRFADLVGNQPQAYARAVVRSRDDLVGPDETRLKLTYEKGWVNVNGYKDFQQDSCASQSTYECLTSYLTPERLRSIEHGDRLAVSLEYAKVDAYRFQPRDDLPVVEVESTHSVIASVGYGRYLQFAGNGNGQPHSRIDLSMSYEDVSDNDALQDRGLVNITYSQRISDSFVLAVGAVYANHPRFLGEVDEEVSVNFGLNYRLQGQSEF